MRGIRLCGSGAAVPRTSLSNDALSQRVDTSDEWIRTRTGIGARRVAAADETLTSLAAAAGAQALANAGWDADSVDLVLLATSSPDDLFGSAPKVQALLGWHTAVLQPQQEQDWRYVAPGRPTLQRPGYRGAAPHVCHLRGRGDSTRVPAVAAEADAAALNEAPV